MSQRAYDYDAEVAWARAEVEPDRPSIDRAVQILRREFPRVAERRLRDAATKILDLRRP